MTRSTISIPSDLHAEIKRMQRGEPKLSNQEGLIRLARMGLFNKALDDLVDAMETISRIDEGYDPDNRYMELERQIKAQKKYLVQLVMLSRHQIVEQFGERGRGIIEKIKESLPEG